jgi:hypothetical protein
MKIITALTGLGALLVMSVPALAANPPKFNAVCPSGITVKSNGSGKVKINGDTSRVKTLTSTSWRAKVNGLSIEIGRDGTQVYVSTTDGEVCDVTKSSAEPNADGSSGGVPAKDQQACLAAVSRKTNNGIVDIGDLRSSEANNEVIVLVGKQKARWQCLVKNGRVAGVMSLTDEGGL